MKAYEELVESLDQLVKVYRQLLETVRRENDILVSAKMDEISSVNQTKEKLIYKVRELDDQWQKAAQHLATEFQMPDVQPSLMELSRNYRGDEAVKLEQIHSVLTLLVARITEINKRNEVLVQAALSHITGAMNSITETLNENPLYKKSGGMEPINKDAQGRLVQREV
jgi:flagellar biosynthesis/type III secretory pathway chaperone